MPRSIHPAPIRSASIRPGSHRPASIQPPTAPAAPPIHHQLWRALGALLLAVTALLGAGTAASAHDTLTDSSPTEGEALTESPGEVRLTYSASILELGAAVEVTDADGRSWPTGELVVDSTDVTVPLTEDLPNGAYEVTWRVTSSDGHPISGVIPFTVEAPATETAPADPAPTTGAEPGETSDPAAPTSEDPDSGDADNDTTSEDAASEDTVGGDAVRGDATGEEADGEATATTPRDSDTATTSSEDGSSVPWTPIVIGLVVLVAALVVFAAVRRRGADR